MRSNPDTPSRSAATGQYLETGLPTSDTDLATDSRSRMLKRSGQPMGMNNGGDTIDLVDKDGNVVDSVTYRGVEEGEEALR